MIYLLYDGTMEGFFTAVFEVYEYRHDAVRLRKAATGHSFLFDAHREVITDLPKAERVARKLDAISREALLLLYKCLLSEEEGIEDAMLGALRYALKDTRDIFSDYGDPDVLRLRQTEKKINRERHRMTAFVRFQLSTDGLYHALVEPDFDVLPLLITHFKGRYADQRWLIYDLKRHYGIYYNLDRVEYVSLSDEDTGSSEERILLTEGESFYQQLWKDYFKSTNIKARKNRKLHLQHVPKRYWRYLTEKLPDV